MTTAEKFAALGGLAGFLSVLASIAIAVDSRRTSSKQLEIAAEANAATKLSIENQVAANAITKLSVDNQIEMSNLARSASVRIADATVLTREQATERGELDDLGVVDYEGPLAVFKLVVINEGMASAYNAALLPTAVGNDQLFRHHRAGFIIQGPEHPFPGTGPFASDPVGRYLSIPAGHTVAFKAALKIGGYDPMSVPHVLEYELFYEDGLGAHRRVFQFGFHGPGAVVQENGWVSKVDRPSNAKPPSA